TAGRGRGPRLRTRGAGRPATKERSVGPARPPRAAPGTPGSPRKRSHAAPACAGGLFVRRSLNAPAHPYARRAHPIRRTDLADPSVSSPNEVGRGSTRAAPSFEAAAHARAAAGTRVSSPRGPSPLDEPGSKPV